MGEYRKQKTAILIELLLLFLLLVMGKNAGERVQETNGDALLAEENGEGEKDFIKWVDFNASCEALTLAYHTDVDTYGTDAHIDWIELLAYGAAKSGGEFGSRSLRAMEAAAKRVTEGESVWEEEIQGMESYAYYVEAYDGALGGMVGEFLLQEEDETGAVVWRRKYGLKAFSPIAESFPYSDFDDFGSSRSYGYARPHLGHDMMGQIGTPI